MVYLGINQDLYDCGVTLTDGRRVLFAANEERYTRVKNQGGFPRHALQAAFEFTGIVPADVGRIVAVGEMTPPLPMRALPRLQRWLIGQRRKPRHTLVNRLVDAVVFHTPLTHTRPSSSLRRLTRPFLAPAFRCALPRALCRTPVSFVEHHRAHADAAWALSGFGAALTITADGMGDGLSMTVNRCTRDSIERLWSAASRDSFGLFFELLTEALGFTPCRDEGKLTGLAAAGNPEAVSVEAPFVLDDGGLRYVGPHGPAGVRWAEKELAGRYSREDISAWAQRLLETHVTGIARAWLRRTGLSHLAVAGGVFANVKLNQRLHELDEVEALFVCPNMGDGGLSLGAVCAEGGLPRRKVTDVFWGETHSESEMERALRDARLAYRRSPNMAGEIASRVAAGNLVACYRGPMEWGPRALGNRSVLARTDDPALTARLGDRLRRSDFMPFAPAALDEDADRCVRGLAKARHAAEFMTACFDCTEEMKRAHPAVVHADGTARLQVVRHDANPAFHAVLAEYAKMTGWGVMLNTSFNMHEEPIVRTPAEAVSAFTKAGLDALALGPFVAEGPR